MYFSASSGVHGWWLTVQAMTLPRPETAVGATLRLAQWRQTGAGGWK